MQYLMGACLAYAILFLLMGAVGLVDLLARLAVALVRLAMRQRRK